MDKLIKNFNKILEKDNLFIQATSIQINKLKALFGDGVDKIVDFYARYQPYDIPMLKSYVQLLGIDNIIEENTNAEPGKYLAEYGVYVFALTVGGNVLCIDTNNAKDGDTSVLIADSNFCSYNEFRKCVEIGIIPEEVMEQFTNEEIIPMNYTNITKCLKKVEDSFMQFMLKLSNDEYEDIEEYLE